MQKVKWIVNDMGELGVKVGDRFFFLYKGDSIEYKNGMHDDGTPIMYRIVGKREFGETCKPDLYYSKGYNKTGAYTEKLVFHPGLSYGKPEDGEWKPLIETRNDNTEQKTEGPASLPVCDKCGGVQSELGGLEYGPPRSVFDDAGRKLPGLWCRKLHICTKCTSVPNDLEHQQQTNDNTEQKTEETMDKLPYDISDCSVSVSVELVEDVRSMLDGLGQYYLRTYDFPHPRYQETMREWYRIIVDRIDKILKQNDTVDRQVEQMGESIAEPNCSTWIPVEAKAVPDGMVCDMVRCGK